MVSVMTSAIINGASGMTVDVECDSSAGMPGMSIIGLADTVVKEAADRTKYAIRNSGFLFPKSKITINVAPADVKKGGSYTDLAIALSVLKHQAGDITEEAEKIAAVGEINLAGEVLGVRGILPLLISLQERGVEAVIIPKANFKQANLLIGMKIYAVSNLSEAFKALLEPNSYTVSGGMYEKEQIEYEDFSDVCGQEEAKRALEIACAGGHNVLMMGPPGSGKSMLSKRIPGILPDLEYEEVLELTKIYSVSNSPIVEDVIKRRPFRSPHHGASSVALCGGGRDLSPGEISLAHRGVLFLDELPEYSRNFLESIRAPIEDKEIHIARATGSVVYPANFTLVAAFNPCPCGYYGDKERICTCTPMDIKRYQNKISGPILDRFDIQIVMSKIPYDDLRSSIHTNEKSIDIRKRVENARNIQSARFNEKSRLNSDMDVKEIKKYCKLDSESEPVLEKAYRDFSLSARSLNSALKVARTISDLKGLKEIDKASIIESLSYRRIDRLLRG